MNISNKLKKWFHPIEISYGSIFEKNNTDFEITGDIVPVIPQARNSFNSKGIQYNQPDVHANSCSAHGTGGALSDLTGIRWTLQEVRDIWNQEVLKGNASPAWGGYTAKMIDAWRGYWNIKHPEDKIISISIPMGSALMYECLDKGYTIAMGYKNHIGYNEDWMSDKLVNKDWIAGDGEDWGNPYESGHCLRLAKALSYNVNGNDLVEVDNYNTTPGRIYWKNNVYGVEKKWIDELVRRGIWHAWGYVFLFENDIPSETNQVINRKLLERFEGEGVFNADLGKFAFIQDGIPYELNSITDLVTKFKTKDKKSSKICGLTKKDWSSLGKIIKK